MLFMCSADGQSLVSAPRFSPELLRNPQSTRGASDEESLRD